MTLLHLSIRRCRYGYPQPRVPTNDDRARAFRAAWTPPKANAFPWPHLRSVAPPARHA